MPDPMICGGVYEYVDYAERTQRGVMVSVTVEKSGKKVGTLLFGGHAPETMYEEADKFMKMRLIGRPASPKVGRPKKG
jgi:hypothetical protein